MDRKPNMLWACIGVIVLITGLNIFVHFTIEGLLWSSLGAGLFVLGLDIFTDNK